MEINAFNKYMVGGRGEKIVILNPPRELSPNDALLLAAYLVELSEHNADYTFDRVREVVQNT